MEAALIVMLIPDHMVLKEKSVDQYCVVMNKSSLKMELVSHVLIRYVMRISKIAVL